jgi:Tfp pilus assembly protein PilX
MRSNDSVSGEKGSALVIAIFSLFLVATMGISLLYLADSDVKLNQAGLRAKKAFYLAEAGLEEGRKALRAQNIASTDPSGLSDELAAAAGTGGVIDASPTTIAPVWNSAGQVTGFTGYGNDVPLKAFTAFGGGWYAAFLTNDSVDGIANKTDSNDRVMITAIGAGTDRSVEVVQSIVELDSLPALPAVVTMLGPTPVAFDGGSSNSKKFNGNDCQGATGYNKIPGLSMPTVGTMGPAQQAYVQANTTGPTFTSGGYTGAQTVDDSTSLLDPRWTVTANPSWSDCSYLKEMADRIKNSADYVCTSGSPCTHWATSTTSTITYVDGDINLPAGKGLLWVTGTVTVNGSTDWEGTIYVVGKGQFIRSGGGSGHTWGGIVIADIAGPDGVWGTGDDCTGGTNGFMGASFTTSGGGSHDTVYCTDAINQANSGLPMVVKDFRQR